MRVTQVDREWMFGPGDTVTAGQVVDPEEDAPGDDELTMAELMAGLAEGLAADPNVAERDRRHAADIAAQLKAGEDRVSTLHVIATRSEIDAMRSDPAVAEVSSTADRLRRP